MIPTAHDKKILVIEDDKSLRKAIVEKITLNGFTCIGAADGEEGSQVALEMKPDLIVLDLLLPKFDGMTVLKGLRAKYGKTLPVIILTNVEPDDKLLGSVIEYQPSFYLVKSDIELDTLINHIKEILQLDKNSTVTEV